LCHSALVMHSQMFHVLFCLLLCDVWLALTLHHTRMPLIRREQPRNDGRRRRRRLSFLMDSFVDPTISDDYFYAVLYVGSPVPQRVEMALDTGSGLPYFACSPTCTHCGKHDDMPFKVANSSSFEWLPCNHKMCGDGRCTKLSVANDQSICEWSQKYVDKSSISAAVASDVMSFYKYPFLPLDTYRITAFNKAQHRNVSGAGVPMSPLQDEKKLRIVFGCSEREANTIYRQGADGVMGLSMHSRSFVDQLFNEQGLGSKRFAHCFGVRTGGLLLFGGAEIDQVTHAFNIEPQWTPLITKHSGHGWYRVQTVGFTVETPQSTQSQPSSKDDAAPSQSQTTRRRQKQIDVAYTSNVGSGYHGSVLDTGSSTLSMPRAPAQNIMKALLEIVNQIDTHRFEWSKDPTKNYDFFLQWNDKKVFNDEEWTQFQRELLPHFPDIVMLWKSDSESKSAAPLRFVVPAAQYLLFKAHHICLDLFGDTPSILVGSNVMINKFMIYDREHMKIGVADIDCDSLLLERDATTTKQPLRERRNDIDVQPIAMDSQVSESTEDQRLESQRPVVMIHLANYGEMYLMYFVGVTVAMLCACCTYIKCKTKNNNTKESRNSGRHSNVRYSQVSLIDDDWENDAEDKKAQYLPKHRRKKSATQLMATADHSNGSMHVNMDMLSSTTISKTFTSEQHKTQQYRNGTEGI